MREEREEDEEETRESLALVAEGRKRAAAELRSEAAMAEEGEADGGDARERRSAI